MVSSAVQCSAVQCSAVQCTSDLLEAVVAIKSSALVPVAEDVVPLEEIQDATAVDADAKLDEVVDHPDEQMQLWEWVDVYHERLQTGNGEAFLDHVCEILHPGRVGPGGHVHDVHLVQVAEGPEDAGLEGAGAVAECAGVLAAVGGDADDRVEQAEVHDHLQVRDLMEPEVLHDLSKVEVPLWDDGADSERKQPGLTTPFFSHLESCLWQEQYRPSG